MTETIFVQLGEYEISASAPEGFWSDSCEARTNFVKNLYPGAVLVKNGAGDTWTFSQSVV